MTLKELVDKAVIAASPDRGIGGRAKNSGNISVSRLIRSTAAAYAKELIDEAAGIERHDTIDPWYALRGNAVADKVMQQLTPHREIELALDVGDGVTLTGHPDGIVQLPNNSPLVVEFKTHAEATKEKIDIAMRQSTLYTAMLRAIERRGTGGTIPPAPWADASAKSWVIDPRAPSFSGLVGVVVGTWDDYYCIENSLTESDLDFTLEYYSQKAKAIHKAVLANDIAGAVAFDRMNGMEFVRPINEAHTPAHIDEDLVKALQDVKRHIEDAEAVEAKYRAEIIQALDQSQTDRATVGSFDVHIVTSAGRRSADVKALERDGLGQYIKQGMPSRSLRIKEVSSP